LRYNASGLTHNTSKSAFTATNLLNAAGIPTGSVLLLLRHAGIDALRWVG